MSALERRTSRVYAQTDATRRRRILMARDGRLGGRDGEGGLGRARGLTGSGGGWTDRVLDFGRGEAMPAPGNDHILDNDLNDGRKGHGDSRSDPTEENPAGDDRDEGG